MREVWVSHLPGEEKENRGRLAGCLSLKNVVFHGHHRTDV